MVHMVHLIRGEINDPCKCNTVNFDRLAEAYPTKPLGAAASALKGSPGVQETVQGELQQMLILVFFYFFFFSCFNPFFTALPICSRVYGFLTYWPAPRRWASLTRSVSE